MSEREQALFRKGKTPIIAKYSSEHVKLMSAIAGRGFLYLPGYAYEAETGLELNTKMKLSELNMKILSETIERELKQSGFDYDLAYRDAMIVWEDLKQVMMQAWEAEYALIKQGMSNEEEALNILAIEVSKRAITLMEAKTLIEEQMESYRKTLAELDGTVVPYEVQLANARLLTAQKKSELIPVIEEILAKEQELLTLQQSKASYLTDYMTAVEEVATKKGTLIPYLLAYADKTNDLAAKMTAVQIPLEEQIADEKVAQAQAMVDKSIHQVNELTVNIETEEKKLEYAEGKRALGDEKFGYGQAINAHEMALTDTYQNVLEADHAVGIAAERQMNASLISDKQTIGEIHRDMRQTSANTMSNAGQAVSDLKTTYEKNAAEIIAEYQSAAKITAALKHIIG